MFEQRTGQKLFVLPGPDPTLQVIQPAVRQYYQKVLSYDPIAYWPNWDALGSGTAEELVNSPAQDGTHTNVTCGQPGIGDGRTSCWYDGVNSRTDVFSAAFQAAWDGDEGTMLCWARVANAGVWADGADRMVTFVGQLLIRFVDIFKDNPNNINAQRVVPANVRGVAWVAAPTTTWMCLAVTWSVAANEVRCYWDGAQQGAPQIGPVAWGANPITQAWIGSLLPLVRWHGWLAHCAVWDSALAPAAMADLASIY